MKILALDLATVTGFAFGNSGGVPISGSVRLRRPGEAPEVAAFNALAFLRDRFALDRPDLLFLEAPLNPAAQKSADAALLQIMVYGVVVATARSYDVPYEKAHPSTIRKHFIGAANAGARADTKRAVINRCHLLGYLPRDIVQDDRADAIAAWDFACATYARARSPVLHLFGESAE